MNKKNTRFLVWVASATGLALVGSSMLWIAGYRINETESLPTGIWRITGKPNTAERGQIINFCPPVTPVLETAKIRGYLRDGPCPGNLEPLFKPVVAIAGDIVSVTGEGVAVNGVWIANSQPMAADGIGRIMPTLINTTHLVQAGEVWVVSSYTPLSFDSRYFGAIKVTAIAGAVQPIWIDGALP